VREWRCISTQSWFYRKGGLLTLRQVFPRSKRPRYSLNCRLEVPDNNYGHFGEKKILLTLPKIKTRIPVFKPVAQSLYRLRFPSKLSFLLKT
jgi:hypothetical protein